MSFLQLVLLLDKTIEGINSILPIVSYRNTKLPLQNYGEYDSFCNFSWTKETGKVCTDIAFRPVFWIELYFQEKISHTNFLQKEAK